MIELSQKYPVIQDNNLSQFLDWRQRPSEINQKIIKTFKSLSSCSESMWGSYNGANHYYMLEIEEPILIKKMIQHAQKEKKDFYVLDIGAGNFQWGRELEKFINKQEDLPEDITVHIIGIRGEGGPEIRQNVGKCKIYELTAFKVECLFEEFKNRELFLENKLDFVISRWCFRHLVDPLGTLLQTYHLLQPGSGLLTMDGFFFFDKEDTWKDYVYPGEFSFNANLINLFVKMKAPFLMQSYSICNSLNRFMLKRTDDTSCQLEMSYKGIEDHCTADIGSRCVTKFDVGKKYSFNYFFNKFRDPNKDYIPGHHLYGNKFLYNWLRKNELIPMHMEFVPSNEDYPVIQEKLKIHQAVIEGDVQAIEKALESGLDIDESDLNGYTPLHLAVKNNQLSCFKFLLEKGANVNIADYEEITPLEEAKQLNKEEYIEILMKEGAN